MRRLEAGGGGRWVGGTSEWMGRVKGVGEEKDEGERGWRRPGRVGMGEEPEMKGGGEGAGSELTFLYIIITPFIAFALHLRFGGTRQKGGKGRKGERKGGSILCIYFTPAPRLARRHERDLLWEH